MHRNILRSSKQTSVVSAIAGLVLPKAVILGNYTFLTREVTMHGTNVYAGQKQSIEGVF